MVAATYPLNVGGPLPVIAETSCFSSRRSAWRVSWLRSRTFATNARTRTATKPMINVRFVTKPPVISFGNDSARDDKVASAWWNIGPPGGYRHRGWGLNETLRPVRREGAGRVGFIAAASDIPGSGGPG